MYRLYVGIDVSKDSFSVAGLNPEGKELIRESYSMDAEGLDRFLKAMLQHCNNLKEVLAAMEST